MRNILFALGILLNFCIDAQAQKLVTIGDSQTASCQWQPWLQEWLSLAWSAEETLYGTEGHRPMAVGGTWLKPFHANSIVLRGRDAIYYQPDIIIIYAGQNDDLKSWKSANNPKESSLEIVKWETPYNDTIATSGITSIAAFKGLIEYLKSELPDTQIYLMTHVPILCVIGMNPTGEFEQQYSSPRFSNTEDVIDFELNERYPKDDYIRALGQYYDLPVIDLWKYSGITYENTQLYYGNPAGDCTQVHLNAEGDKLIARCIAQYIASAPHHNDPDWTPKSNSLSFENMTDSAQIIFTPTGIRQHKTIKKLPAGIYLLGDKKILKQ